MKQKEQMNKNNEELSLGCKAGEKEVFNEIIDLVRENLVATFVREGDTSLIIRLVSGQKFHLSIEEVADVQG